MREQFEAVFAKGQVPDDVDEFTFKREGELLEALVSAAIVPSKSEARRLVKQNAVSWMDGEKITDPQLILRDEDAGKTLKVGKRKFLKLI